MPKHILILLIAILTKLSAAEALAQQIKSNSFYPSWSASGDLIAFSSNRNGNYDIYVMDKDGKNVRQVTSYPENEFWPSWIGDRHIVFDANIHGNEEIYRIKVNGRGLIRLTFDTTAYDGVASVSMKSNIILFDSNREEDGLADVWMMNSKGKNQKQITRLPKSQGHPSFSPDEKVISYKVKLNDTIQEIFTMRSDGTEAKQITFHNAISQHPSWSPDGKSIVYASNLDGDFDIYRMDLLTGDSEKLTDNSEPDYRPSYSPDGKHILFCTRIDNVWQVRLLTLSTNGIKSLTEN